MKLHSYMVVFSTLMLLTTQVTMAVGMGCKDTENGNPIINGGNLVCTIEETFDDNGGLSNNTFGIVKNITARIPLTISTDITQLASIFTQSGIQIPAQQLSIQVETSNGAKLPADITTAPSLGIAPGTPFGCGFKFNSFNAGVTDLKSEYLPDWLGKGLVNLLNNNDQVKQKALDNANDLLTRALAKNLSCPN